MRIYTAVSFCMLFGCTASWSAALSGVVIDTLTKAPVESVLVQVKGTGAQTYTDTAGKFTLNTTTGAIERAHDTKVSPAWHSGMPFAVSLYDARGSRIMEKTNSNTAVRLSGRPDAVYFVKAGAGITAFAGRLLEINGVCAAIGPKPGQASETLAKTSLAAATLLFTHKYYTTKEVSVNEGDLNVTAQLAIWWPDSTTTGVQPGITLTAYTGGTIANGAVIQNKNITSTLTISADNVTIRNCRIHLSGGYFGIQHTGGTNLLVENCEISSTNGTTGLYTGITGGNATIRKCNINGWENGMSAGSNLIVEDCYIHRPGEDPSYHVDGIEWGGGSNVTIRHNHIVIRDETGCVNIGGSGGETLTNNRVLKNLFSGGTYSLYIDGRGLTITNQQVIGNVWVKGSYTYGTHAVMNAAGTVWQYNCLNDGTPVQP